MAPPGARSAHPQHTCAARRDSSAAQGAWDARPTRQASLPRARIAAALPSIRHSAIRGRQRRR
eukprot:10685216-Alexandrium_andersonii.AAC.1